MKQEDTLLVGFSNQHDDDNAVLIIGRKAPGEAVDIVNEFQSEKAIDIYKNLITNVKNV